MKVPIACTLESSEARAQLGEWREMLRRVVDGSERVGPGRLELRLSPDVEIASVIDLAQRETACSAFFSFSIEIRADHLVLAVEVPDDTVEILDQFVSEGAI